jgi:hypothetical protein
MCTENWQIRRRELNLPQNWWLLADDSADGIDGCVPLETWVPASASATRHPADEVDEQLKKTHIILQDE